MPCPPRRGECRALPDWRSGFGWVWLCSTIWDCWRRLSRMTVGRSPRMSSPLPCSPTPPSFRGHQRRRSRDPVPKPCRAAQNMARHSPRGAGDPASGSSGRRVAKQVASEISRLEDIFSLYRLDSAVPRLNRSGSLANRPFELLECLSLAGAVHRASEGRFDPTIQPLWASYAEAFALGTPPTSEALQTARDLTG